MARSPAQSDFVVERPAPIAEVVLPDEAQAVSLPRAEVRTNLASAGATRWVLTVTIVMLVALVLLLLIGPHIPAGE
jgi:hypothetical protein